MNKTLWLDLARQKPDIKISVRQTFNLDTDMEVNGFSENNEYVPKIDKITNLIGTQPWQFFRFCF